MSLNLTTIQRGFDMALGAGAWDKLTPDQQGTTLLFVAGYEWAKAHPAAPVARFSPPPGRIVHGMGQFHTANNAFLTALGDPALHPVSTLLFFQLNSQAVGPGLVPYRGSLINVSLLLAVVEGQGRDVEVAAGQFDARIHSVAAALKAHGDPVILRVGPEFSGAWSGYHVSHYVAAYRRVVDIFRAEGVGNVAFCWCYCPPASGVFEPWYPGDEYVDWFGLDCFHRVHFSYPAVLAFLAMAEAHDKPVVMAEVSSINAPMASAKWDDWLGPYFAFLEAHPVITAFNYISFDWSTSKQYAALGWRDGDLTHNPAILARYIEELRKPKYLHLPEIGALAP